MVQKRIFKIMSTIALTQELYFQEHKGLDIYAWVLMSNHLHMIIGTRDDHRIGDVMRDFKKYTSKKIVAAIIDNERESRKEWLLNRLSFMES